MGYLAFTYSQEGDVHNISSVVVQNETNLCVRCTFHDDSASACVVIYYGFADNYYDLIIFNSWKIDRVLQEAYDCVEVPPVSIAVHVAVFAFSNEQEMIYGQPLNSSYERYNLLNQGMYSFLIITSLGCMIAIATFNVE